jgi:ABC-type dipeptide/oligopeptide/nickel transport system ATPase component
MRLFRHCAAVAAAFGFSACAQAQELKIGLSAEPSAMDPHFHPRCPFAMPRCKAEAPALKEIAPGRRSACHLNEAG